MSQSTDKLQASLRTIKISQADLQKREEDLNRKNDNSETKEEELKIREEALNTREENLNYIGNAQDVRYDDLSDREKNLKFREELLRQEELNHQHTNASIETNLRKWEADLRVREDNVGRMEKNKRKRKRARRYFQNDTFPSDIQYQDQVQSPVVDPFPSFVYQPVTTAQQPSPKYFTPKQANPYFTAQPPSPTY